MSRGIALRDFDDRPPQGGFVVSGSGFRIA
jgi:hypothetical protein